MTEQLAWKRWHACRDKRAGAFLLNQYRPLAYRIARDLPRPATMLEQEDVEAICMTNLAESLQTFDPARKVKFITWAYAQVHLRARRDIERAHPFSYEYARNQVRLRKATETLAEDGQEATPEALMQALHMQPKTLAALGSLPRRVPYEGAHSGGHGWSRDDQVCRSLYAETSPELGDPLALVLARETDLPEPVQAAFNRLTTRERQILTLRFRDLMPYRDMGALLGISLQRVQSITQRALLDMRIRLGLVPGKPRKGTRS